METTTDIIPFGDLAQEVHEISQEINTAVGRVLASGWFVLGQECNAFEIEFASYLGAQHVVGCGNGTDAITLALRALELPPGAEVITVANTCVPTAAGIRDAGCTLRLVDCHPETLEMDASALERALISATRAVVPVHLYGSCPDIEEISRICQRAGVPLVEDCAQAHGALFKGHPAGRWGVMSAWSFYPSKNLGAYGDGGAVVTDDPGLAKRLQRLRNYGQRARYYHDDEGRNSRLDEMQAAILRVKLRHLDSWNERRRHFAGIYQAELGGSGAQVPTLTEGCVSVRHLYPIRVPAARRDQIRDEMKHRGVDTQIHYPVPIHRQNAYASMFRGEEFPAAEQAAAEILTLPLYPQLDEAHVRRVAAALRESIEL